jgi:hypothetical protein
MFYISKTKKLLLEKIIVLVFNFYSASSTTHIFLPCISRGIETLGSLEHSSLRYCFSVFKHNLKRGFENTNYIP